jgi:hypothetical protein
MAWFWVDTTPWPSAGRRCRGFVNGSHVQLKIVEDGHDDALQCCRVDRGLGFYVCVKDRPTDHGCPQQGL